MSFKVIFLDGGFASIQYAKNKNNNNANANKRKRKKQTIEK